MLYRAYLGTALFSSFPQTLPMPPLSTSLVGCAIRDFLAFLPPCHLPPGRPAARRALRARVPGHAAGGAPAAVRAAAAGPGALRLRAAASPGPLHSPAQEPGRKRRAGSAGGAARLRTLLKQPSYVHIMLCFCSHCIDPSYLRPLNPCIPLSPCAGPAVVPPGAGRLLRRRAAQRQPACRRLPPAGAAGGRGARRRRPPYGSRPGVRQRGAEGTEAAGAGGGWQVGERATLAELHALHTGWSKDSKVCMVWG